MQSRLSDGSILADISNRKLGTIVRTQSGVDKRQTEERRVSQVPEVATPRPSGSIETTMEPNRDLYCCCCSWRRSCSCCQRNLDGKRRRSKFFALIKPGIYLTFISSSRTGVNTNHKYNNKIQIIIILHDTQQPIILCLFFLSENQIQMSFSRLMAFT